MTEIRVGVCGWGDHDLYPPKTPSKEKLALYARHFDVVEVDSSYHAIQPPERWERWVQETPSGFRFVVKAYREMTGHGRPQRAPERTREEVFDLFEAFSFPPGTIVRGNMSATSVGAANDTRRCHLPLNFGIGVGFRLVFRKKPCSFLRIMNSFMWCVMNLRQERVPFRSCRR
jgi:hypothetical protein